MRYSYATVSLPTLNPSQAADALADAGFTGVEWKLGEAPHGPGSNAVPFLVNNLCTIAETGEAAEEAASIAVASGLSVVGLAPYVLTGEIARMRRIIDMAVRSGAPQIRLQAPRFSQANDSYLRMRDEFIDFVAEAVKVARRPGIRLVIEIHHNTIVPSVGLAMPVLERFDPDEVGVIYDVGNMVYEGYEDYRIGIELLGGRLHHVHLKNVRAERAADGRWSYEWAHLDDGLVDVSRFLGLLESSGYTGWISIEDLTFGDDSRAGIRYNADVLARVGAPGWSGAPLEAAQISSRA